MEFDLYFVTPDGGFLEKLTFKCRTRGERYMCVFFLILQQIFDFLILYFIEIEII